MSLTSELDFLASVLTRLEWAAQRVPDHVSTREQLSVEQRKPDTGQGLLYTERLTGVDGVRG